MINYLWNNKEWLFSGIGVTAVLAIIWFIRRVFPRKNVNQFEPDENPQGRETTRISQSMPNSVSAQAIIEDISSRPPYQQEECSRHYVGLKIRWKVNVVSVSPQETDRNKVNLHCNHGGSYPWVYARNVSLTAHPELKIIKSDSPIWVSGTIERIHGHEIDLADVDVG